MRGIQDILPHFSPLAMIANSLSKRAQDYTKLTTQLQPSICTKPKWINPSSLPLVLFNSLPLALSKSEVALTKGNFHVPTDPVKLNRVRQYHKSETNRALRGGGEGQHMRTSLSCYPTFKLNRDCPCTYLILNVAWLDWLNLYLEMPKNKNK